MSDSVVMHELSRSLTERERKDLLNKIRKSINLDDLKEKSLYHKDMSQQERDLLISQDISRSSIFARLILWIQSIAVGKEKEEVFLNQKLKRLRSEINRRTPGITGFELRNLYPKFAEAFFGLYSKVFNLIPLFRDFWEKTEIFEKALYSLITRKIPDSKTNLTELLDQETMEAIYSKSGQKDSIRKELIRRIDSYIDSLDPSFFQEIEKIILPLYYVKEVILFPYFTFFKLFHFVPKPGDKKPLFKTASAIVALDFMEQMFYAVYTAMKIPEPIAIDPEFTNSLIHKDEEKPENENAGVVNLTDDIPALIEEIRNFFKTIPLVELIRYFRKDPYYQLIFYIPKIDLNEFYRSTLRIRVLPQLDEIFEDVRRNVVEKKIADLFTGEKLRPFLYYREYTSSDLKKLGLPTFTFVKTLNLIYNFIAWYYHDYIQEIVQILSMGLLKHNRIPLGRLLANAATLEDIEDKIRQFDLSLSSDEEDGKLFQRLRVSMAGDPSHQRLYRNLITQKDKTAQGFIDRGLESFYGLKKIFEEILTSPTEMIKQRLTGFYYVRGKSESLNDLLSSRNAAIDKFANLLRSISRIEKGS